jgi:cytoskeletal protein CcmA (bactofilin family)
MFNKTAETPLAPHGKSMAGSSFSVFGADIRIVGDVAASADLHIDGRIEGDVACTALVQGEASEIVGGIKAETARLSGTVRGTIDVRELVVLKTARIHGDVHYDALTIEQGAQVEGRFAPRTNAAATAPDDEPRLTLAG